MKYPYFTDDPSWSNGYLWPVLQRLLEKHAPPPRELLDLGCGNGAMSRMLATMGYRVTGIDPSESGIALAKQYESESLRFEIGSTTENLAARFGTFPVVVSLEVIEHCPSASEYMRAFRSVLAPGGVGILSTPYHGYLKNLVVTASGRFDHHFDPLWEGGHLRFFSVPKLRTLFKEAGFSRFEFHRVGRIPPLAKSVVAVLFNE